MRRHVYFYTHLEQPFAEAAVRLAGLPALWLPAPAEPNGSGWRVRLHANGPLPAKLASRMALVTVGSPDRVKGQLLRTITWRAVAREQLFPILVGDLELAELGGEVCQLSLMGSYRPPLAVIGQAGDRLVGHRVAEACVRRFVLDVGDRLAAAGSPNDQ